MNKNFKLFKSAQNDLESVRIGPRSVPAKFWADLDDLKLSFIFVHSVHSMNQEHARTSQESLSCGHSLY